MIQHVSSRRIKQLWQEYRRTRRLPTLGKPGRPRNHLPINEETIILEAFDRYQAGAVALESILRARYGVRIPHNRIHKVLRVNGRAMTQPAKQLRRRWVRYERTHSMSLWHTDWKQLPDNRWIIAYMDDASRLIVGYGVFESERREKGTSQFEAYLAKNGIRHILCRVIHPQTKGKLERFYDVCEQKQHQFRSIDEYAQWKNTIKPHLSLNIEAFETPIQASHK